MIPPTRILAAVDFSEASRTAYACAARLAHQCRVRLDVLYVEDALLAAAARTRGVELREEAMDELRRLYSAHCRHTSCAPHYHVVVGQAVNTILATAQREGASLVVVGARGMSGAERLVFGSTTEGLLRQARVSVLVVPESWTAPNPEAPDLTGTGPIIAGIDMTSPSIEAGAAAARLARLLKTDAILLHVVPELRVPDRWWTHAATALQGRLDQCRLDLERLAKGMEAAGPVRLEVASGSIPHRLAEAAHASPHAMLVLGRALRRRGNGPPGAIAYRVLTLARVPVLMHIPS
ncbi:MAG: universal stress protein [Acidobacteria bacterium]|nr:universal stress protein [Acidobacteriota bacterium]